MTTEHLLDAIGLLDDKLIQEAENYTPQKRRANQGIWLGWAASFAVVLVLGYGLTHFGMGGGSTGSAGGNMPQSSAGGSSPTAPADSVNGAVEPSGGSGFPAIDEETLPPGCGETFDAAVEIFGMEPGQIPAIMVDGTLYWDSSVVSVIRPEEGDIRYSTSYIDGIPEEDGQTNFRPEGVRYLVLAKDRVAVNWNGSYEWYIFTSDPLPESE